MIFLIHACVGLLLDLAFFSLSLLCPSYHSAEGLLSSLHSQGYMVLMLRSPL